MTMTACQVPQRKAGSGRGCDRRVSWAGSLRFGRRQKSHLKLSILHLVLVIALLGCQSRPAQKKFTWDPFRDQAIYAVLKGEPVPILRSSPYDGDPRRRAAFDEGFRSGWDRAISGALLHGTFGTPTDLSWDLQDAWSAGWHSGAKLGSDQWLAESLRQQEMIRQPDAAASQGFPSAVAE